VPARTIARLAEFRGAARPGSKATTVIRASDLDERNLSEAVECRVAAECPAAAAAEDIRR